MSETRNPATGKSTDIDRLFPGERERAPGYIHRPAAPSLEGSTAQIDLSEIPETLLWPLWNRAAEMKRSNRLIEDPLAVELVEKLDYDFERYFGKPAFFHAVRARVSDDLIFDYLLRVPSNAVVVALGEGLETQLWRIAEPRISWISVDLPGAISVRRSCFPSQPQNTLVECSALDPAWMDAVPENATPFISATGLLMCFEEDEVRKLLSQIAARFPGAELFFDTITPYRSRRSLKGQQVSSRYTEPPMPWGITLDNLGTFLEHIPGMKPLKIQGSAEPFPDRARWDRLASRIAPLRRRYTSGLAHARMQP